MRRAMILTVATALVVGATGCGSSNKTVTPPVRGTIDIELTKSGCKPQHLRVHKGLTHFKITNKGADAVSEFRVSDQRNQPVGLIDHLTPGLSGTFSVNLQPGTYNTACPGGTGASAAGDIVVTGTATTTTTEPLTPAAQAVATYRAYAEKEGVLLARAMGRFTKAIKNNDLVTAKRLYPMARTHFERIEPIADRFGMLAAQIDALASEQPPAQFVGFHRIERQLWQNGNLDGLEPIADALTSSVAQLQDQIPSVPLAPSTLATGAVELLQEIATRKITGTEDLYSHTDLWDFAANLEGAEQTVAALRPLIAAKDPALVTAIAKRFAATKAVLARYRTPNGFVLYTNLTKADTRKLASQISALAGQVAKVEPLVRS